MASTHLVHLRLVRAFRGYRAGSVIQVTTGLADRLVEDGLAVVEPQRSLLEQASARQAERAVAAAVVEARSSGDAQ